MVVQNGWPLLCAWDNINRSVSMTLNYTVSPSWYYFWPTVDDQSGIEKLAADSNEILIPYLKQSSRLEMALRFFVDDVGEESNASLSICEIFVNGCPKNHYGHPCRPCFQRCEECNAIDGYCTCQAGYIGENCTDECTNGTYGTNCAYSCGHCSNDSCDHRSGYCFLGCTKGWTGTQCNQTCSPGWYGSDCSEQCSSHCITPYLCDRYNGICLGGCAIGWSNDICDKDDTDYCVNWVPSLVSVLYHNITWRKEVINNIIKYDPAVSLQCNFTLNFDEDIFYDVTWLINGEEVFNQTVDITNGFMALITAHDFLRAGKKIGSEVHCKVGTKRKKEHQPCFFKVGNPFFAGIKVLNPSIDLERKGSKNIELMMTIPFASESLYVDGIPQPVSDLKIHLSFETDHSSNCGGGGSSHQCEVKVESYSYDERHNYESDEWKQNISYPIYSQDTDGYVINSHMTLTLRTGGTKGVGSKIFEHVALPDISITVREGNELWKGRSCSVRTDPHMYTFDGKSYECQIPGEFIYYRNQPQLQWIQSKHHLCFPSYDGPWCVCAVAARAGRDVFVIDLCGENVINYELCEDNVLKVTKINDKYYKIFFSTGTSLSIYIMKWSGRFNIDLEILPSAMDLGNVDGLCGFFDGVRENDFKRRNSNITDDIVLKYPNDFSESWKVQDNENLFSGGSLVYNSLLSVSTILVPRCTCTNNGKTECSYNTVTACNSNQGKQYKCNGDLVENRRHKRDVSSIIPERKPIPSIRKKRSVDFIRNQTYSESVCLQAFENSAEYKTCQEYVTDLKNSTISNCIEDIKMTGDENLTQIHVEAALQQCSMFVLLNATLQESEPVVTYTIQNLCPSNCNGHGFCEEGNCTCDAGFGGSDCSFDLTEPPTITSVPSAGLCDLSTTACNEATVFGKYFFENMDSICYITLKQIDINQTEVRQQERQTNLQERTLFEGYCPLLFDTSGIWTTAIKFNISNDGVRFTDTYEVLIYQSTCQVYQNESGNMYFTLKVNFCYIDNTCVSHMQNNSINECFYCNATNDKFDWTETEYCEQTTTERMPTTILRTITSPQSTFISSTEGTTTSSSTEEEDGTTYSLTTPILTTTENSETSLVFVESTTFESTNMSEGTSHKTTTVEETTENLSDINAETTTVMSTKDLISTSTTPVAPKATTDTESLTTSGTTKTSAETSHPSSDIHVDTTADKPSTITSTISSYSTMKKKMTSGEETSTFSSTLTTTQTITSTFTTNPTSTVKITTTSYKETSPSSPFQFSTTTVVNTEDKTTLKVDTHPSTSNNESKSTVHTAASEPTRTSLERIDTTKSTNTKDTKEESTQYEVKNTYLIVGASSSIVGIVILMIIIGLVARTCRKSNKHQENQEEDVGEFNNWRDLVLAVKPTSPRYNTESFVPYSGNTYVPHAPLHLFKSSGRSREFNSSRYQRY